MHIQPRDISKRILHAVTFLLLVIASRVFARAGAADTASSDRAKLIEGVKEIACPGSPGSLAVYDTTASAVVTGSADGGEVAVVACGRLQHGRVVAFAHDGYFGGDTIQTADTARLLTNAMRWAAGGKTKPVVGLVDGHQLQALFEQQGAVVGQIGLDQGLVGIDVLVLRPVQLTPQQEQRIRAFAKQGMGLLVAATVLAQIPASRRPNVLDPVDFGKKLDAKILESGGRCFLRKDPTNHALTDRLFRHGSSYVRWDEF